MAKNVVLKLLKSIDRICLEILDGFKKGRKLSEAEKQNISEWQKKNSPARGRKVSDEVKAKIRAKLIGSKLSEETRRKVGENSLGRHWWTNGEENKFCRESPGDGWVLGRNYRRLNK